MLSRTERIVIPVLGAAIIMSIFFGVLYLEENPESYKTVPKPEYKPHLIMVRGEATPTSDAELEAYKARKDGNAIVLSNPDPYWVPEDDGIRPPSPFSFFKFLCILGLVPLSLYVMARTGTGFFKAPKPH